MNCPNCTEESYCEQCSAAQWDAARPLIMLDRRVSTPRIPPGMTYAEYYEVCKNRPEDLSDGFRP